MRHIGRRGILAGTSVLLATPTAVLAQTQSAGVALVIGNSKYRWEASLPNVKRDAPEVAKRFQALGLKTELLQDASLDAMRTAVDKFATTARGANLAAFYFAGHGASWDKDTFLVPEDADLGDPSVVRSLLPVKAISDATKEAQHRLLVFDNCRNNPADGWRQRAAMDSSKVTKTELAATALHGPNTLVLFSTAPGRVAVDGPAGENSPFAAAFLRQLAEQTIDLQALPARLRRDLLIATEGRQVLWDQSTYEQPFPLANSSGSPSGGARISGTVAPPSAAPSQAVELNNAYAFAREKGLPLPAGLVALRPANASPDGQKVGSYKTTFKGLVGISAFGSLATTLEPLLVIVLSVSGNGPAEIIFSTKDWYSIGAGADGKVWRYIAGTLSGPRLEFRFGVDMTGGIAEALHTLKWSAANSGMHSSKTTGRFYDEPFTRLD
jgi:hypothetical protein